MTKKAIITGGGRSIGRAIAIQLAAEGYEVLVTYCKNNSGANETVREIEAMGGKAQVCHCDLLAPEGTIAFANQAIELLGSVDLLVNNAGLGIRENFLDMTADNFLHTFQVNTIAPCLLSQHIALHMVENNIKGNIIHISSIAATRSKPELTAYSASKAALNKITRNSAIELAKYGIRVNAVSPGVVASGMNEEKMKDPEVVARYKAITPLGRNGAPEDIANMVCYIASDKASWMTGEIVTVDGGVNA